MNTFQDLKQLPEGLKKALAALNFQSPTPIQSAAIPVALEGGDLIGCAQTGSGKTVAFALPLLTRLIEDRESIGLVLVPTRELASQVVGVMESLMKFNAGIGVVSLIGGVPMNPQVRTLARRPRVIVATPGRLIDHLQSRNLSLGRTAMLVLDEADRMLDMGFAPQLNQVLKYLPRERQTMLFSATLPDDILKLASKFLHEPKRVQVNAISQAAPDIHQESLVVSVDKKNETLLDQLNARQGTVIVFARTQSRTNRLAKYLDSYGLGVARLHGGLTQGQRTKSLEQFRKGTARIMVCTDIAARGIDIDHVAHVINFDLPQVPEDYIHRIGRTGRAGRKGESLSLVTSEDRALWRAIEKLLAQKGGKPVSALAPKAIDAVSRPATAEVAPRPAQQPVARVERTRAEPRRSAQPSSRPQSRPQNRPQQNRPTQKPSGARPYQARSERAPSFESNRRTESSPFTLGGGRDRESHRPIRADDGPRFPRPREESESSENRASPRKNTRENEFSRGRSSEGAGSTTPRNKNRRWGTRS